MGTKIRVLIAQGLDVTNFLKDVPSFLKDVPRIPKFILRWGITCNHFIKIPKEIKKP